MSMDSTVVTNPAPSHRKTNWLGIIALVLVCAILGSLGGAVAGGAAGYFVGRRVARSELAQAQTAPAPGYVVPRPTVPPNNRVIPWPDQGRVPGATVYAEVQSVVSGSPAEKAGLKAGDRITAVDGTQLTVRRDLAQLISSHKVGDQVELTVNRNGNQETIRVTLGDNPDNAGHPYLGLTYRMVAGSGSRFPSS